MSHLEILIVTYLRTVMRVMSAFSV